MRLTDFDDIIVSDLRIIHEHHTNKYLHRADVSSRCTNNTTRLFTVLVEVMYTVSI